MARIIFLTDFSEEYARTILRGIARYAKETKPWSLCKLPLAIRDKYGIEEVIHWAKKYKAEAIIGQFYNNDPVEKFRENGIVAVAQDFKERFTSIPNITGSHRLAGEMGAKYFIAKGFKNFAFYGLRGIVWSEERCQGYREAITAHFKTQNTPPQISEFSRSNLDDLWYYDSTRLVTWLESLPKPVAIMACDDNQAYQITEACQQVEYAVGFRIPDDIAVLGVDNDATMCSLSVPNLSSLDQDVERGGYNVARLIDHLIANPNAEWEDVVVEPTHIVTRESTDIYANNDRYIARALKYIHENLAQKLHVEDIVAQVPLSRRLLEVRFREQMNMSIYDYIINTRIEKMAQMLHENLSVAEVANQLGFADTKNIARIFKQIKGVTPSEYRNKITKI
ncbi:MAG: DNA-binding transcriptional regulator [Alistipes sp.]